MRIFKYYQFSRWADSEDISDDVLKKAVVEMGDGLFEANLGSGLYKKRIAKKGKGKSGGHRTIIAFKKDHRAFYIYGYAKNKKANLSPKEEVVYKRIAQYYLEISETKLSFLLDDGELIEVKL